MPTVPIMRCPHRRSTGAAALGLTLAALATGCGAGQTGPIELTFWAWAPNIERVAEIWNEERSDITVTVSETGAGEEAVTKFLTASDAQNPPDLIQAEYQSLTTLAGNDSVADITEHVGGMEDEFAPGAWEQVVLDDTVYAVPQDTAPMMLYYRADLFEEFGLDVPETWAEFAQTAERVREKDGDRYLSTFSTSDPGWFAGLSQQAGAQWWDIKGDSWQVDIDDPATGQVARYWSDLIAEDAIDDQPMYTPEWNTALNEGTLLTWPSAVWAPAVLEGSAADTKGDWAMAPMPQWEEGEEVTGLWGGSTTAVAEGSDQQAAAAEFAAWLNTDPDAVDALVRESALYPASVEGQEGGALDEPPGFLAEQKGFYDQARDISETAQGFTWGPNVNLTYSTYTEAFRAAVQDGEPFTGAVTQMQESTLSDMRDTGYSIAE